MLIVHKAPRESDKPAEALILADMIRRAGYNASFFCKWGNPKEKRNSITPNKYKGKRRLISRPNHAMEALHHIFDAYLNEKLEALGILGKYFRELPSATGCVVGSNPLQNATEHIRNKYFYITDFRNAYQSLDLDRLTTLLVYIFHYDQHQADCNPAKFGGNTAFQAIVRDDPLWQYMRAFVAFAFSGMYEIGLAVGGPVSPRLLNLYCEAYLNSPLRLHFYLNRDIKEPKRNYTYTQYVDDLVFSREMHIPSWERRTIRRYIEAAGFKINHRKSKVLTRSMGMVTVTKIGLRDRPEEKSYAGKPATIAFLGAKRRRLRGIVRSYLTPELHNDSPEVIRGIMAEFLHYYKHVERRTKSDLRLFGLCKMFEKASEKYMKPLKKKKGKKRKSNPSP